MNYDFDKQYEENNDISITEKPRSRTNLQKSSGNRALRKIYLGHVMMRESHLYQEPSVFQVEVIPGITLRILFGIL